MNPFCRVSGTGQGHDALARVLNKLGVPTPSGAGALTHTAVARVAMRVVVANPPHCSTHEYLPVQLAVAAGDITYRSSFRGMTCSASLPWRPPRSP